MGGHLSGMYSATQHGAGSSPVMMATQGLAGFRQVSGHLRKYKTYPSVRLSVWLFCLESIDILAAGRCTDPSQWTSCLKPEACGSRFPCLALGQCIPQLATAPGAMLEGFKQR